MRNSRSLNLPKAGFVAVIAVYGVICAVDVREYRLLDRVDLIAHEAGHLLFGWFGQFLGVLGGTLGQLLVPIVIALYFAFRQEIYSSAVTLFWVGKNFFNVSVYLRDARDMSLPLVNIGGGEVIHDWHYLLSTMGLLRWDRVLGNTVFLVGLVFVVASVILGFYFSYERCETKSVSIRENQCPTRGL